MKKFALGLLVALVVLATNSIAQIHQDSVRGGQLQFVSFDKVRILPSDTVLVKIQWSFNPSFSPVFTQPGGLIGWNTDTLADTVAFTDTLHMSAPGTVFVRLLSIHGSTIDTSNFAPVVVDSIWQHPHISLGAVSAMSHGATQLYYANSAAGHQPATVYLYESAGDTSLTYPYLVDVFNVTDASSFTYTFSGYPVSYYSSYKFYIQNPVGFDSSAKGWFQTLPGYSAPYVASVDSSYSSYDSVFVRNPVVTNGLATTVVTRYGTSMSALNDSIVQTLSASTSGSIVWSRIGSLLPSTTYYVKTYARNSVGRDSSGLYSITTGVLPIAFAMHIDTMHILSAASERIHVRFSVPSGTTAQGSVLVADSADLGYSYPVSAPTLVTVSASGTTFVDFDCTGLTYGHTYRVTVYGWDDTSMISPSAGVLFHLIAASPVITSFNSTSTTVSMGGATTLHWSTIQCDSLYIGGGIGVVSGMDSISTGPLYSTTTFTLYGVNAVGTVATANLTIVVNPIDTSTGIHDFYSTRSSIASADTTQIVWNTSGFDSTWIDNGIGLVSDSGSLVVGPLYVNTTYTLTGMKHDGTTIVRSITVSIDESTKVVDIEKQNHVSVFPNPATDVVTITTTDFAVGDFVTLTDVSGKILFNKKVIAKQTSISLDSVGSGTYIVMYNNKYVTKLLKQ